jgi:hypothetical protein
LDLIRIAPFRMDLMQALDPYAVHGILDNKISFLMATIPDPFLVTAYVSSRVRLRLVSACSLARPALVIHSLFRAQNLVFLFFRKLTSRSLQNTKFDGRTMKTTIVVRFDSPPQSSCSSGCVCSLALPPMLYCPRSNVLLFTAAITCSLLSQLQ